MQRASVASIAISNKANNFLLPSIHSAPRLQTCSRSRFPLPSILPPRPPPPPRPFLLFSIACLLACGSFHTNLHTAAEDRRTRKGARRRKGCLQSHQSPHQCLSPWGTAPAPSTPSSSGAAGRRRRLLRVSANHHQSQANAISDSLLPPN